MPTVKLDPDTQTVVARGREAWRTLRNDETWEKWVAIGRAIEAGRLAIMRLLNTNQPKGRTWSQTFGAWLQENEFDQIDKGVRSRLQDCLDHLPEIEAWRQTLGLTLRLQLNHPNAVLRRWQAARQAPAAKDTGSSPRPGLREEVIRLQSELDAAHREIDRLRQSYDEAGSDWDWQDTPEDIAKAMLARFPTKAKRVGAAILAQSKSTQPAPRKRRADPEAKLAGYLWPTPKRTPKA
ncbi:MAG: hypothetical protein JO110_23285 [Acetobacteraceae bacterium]|nr:hypothetical protein [Acetobacteraceae bacterium]